MCVCVWVSVGVITVITTVLPKTRRNQTLEPQKIIWRYPKPGKPKKNTTDWWLSHVEPPIFEENSDWGSSSNLKIENQKYS